MSGPAMVWQQAADNFTRHLQAVSESQWTAPTPCAEWTVRELVDHAVGVQASIGGVVGAGANATDGWDAVAAAVGAALADPANLEGAVPGGPFAGMPKHQLIGIAVADLLLHSWDLAKAIGADTELPAGAVEAVHLGLSRMPAEMMRAPGRFGPELTTGPDASPTERLLAFAGRQP